MRIPLPALIAVTTVLVSASVSAMTKSEVGQLINNPQALSQFGNITEDSLALTGSESEKTVVAYNDTFAIIHVDNFTMACQGGAYYGLNHQDKTFISLDSPAFCDQITKVTLTKDHVMMYQDKALLFASKLYR